MEQLLISMYSTVSNKIGFPFYMLCKVRCGCCTHAQHLGQSDSENWLADKFCTLSVDANLSFLQVLVGKPLMRWSAIPLLRHQPVV